MNVFTMFKIHSETQKNKGEPLTSLIQLYVNFLFCFGLNPFWLVKIREVGEGNKITKCEVRKWCPQTLVFLLAIILAFMTGLGELRSSDFQSTKNPAECFRIVYKAMTLPCILHIAKQTLFNTDNFVDVVNFILDAVRNRLPLPNSKRLLRMRITAFLIMVLSGIMGGTMILFGRNSTFTNKGNLTWMQWWATMVHAGRFIFLFENEKIHLDLIKFNNTNHDEFSYKDLPWGALAAAGFLYK